MLANPFFTRNRIQAFYCICTLQKNSSFSISNKSIPSKSSFALANGKKRVNATSYIKLSKLSVVLASMFFLPSSFYNRNIQNLAKTKMSKTNGSLHDSPRCSFSNVCSKPPRDKEHQQKPQKPTFHGTVRRPKPLLQSNKSRNRA